MKLQRAVQVWLVAESATLGPVWSSPEDEETHHHRSQNLKEVAIHAVERFLWLFQDRRDKEFPGKGSEDEVSAKTRVLWNGRHLLPLQADGEVTRALSTDLAKDHADKSTNDRIGRISHGRKTRRGRKTKGMKQSSGKSSSKDKIPKGAKSSLRVFRKKVKGSKAAADDTGSSEILCFTGFRDDVIDACSKYNAGCCVGSNSCAWYDEGDKRKTTVCQGACNGNEACMGISPGSYISENSCTGVQACNNMARTSTEDDPVYVGPTSCGGIRACQLMCVNSMNCKVKVQENACFDSNGALGVCFHMAAGSSAVTDVYVGANACREYHACYYLGTDNDKLETVGIETGSCSVRESCPFLGRKSTGTDIDILAKTCTEDLSCVKLGYRSQGVALEDNACQGYKSCFEFGYSASSGAVSIGPKACRDKESCYKVGFNAPNYVIVAADSCVYEAACFGVGRDVTDKTVLIGEQACDSNPNQCSGKTDSSCYTTANIRRYGRSC